MVMTKALTSEHYLPSTFEERGTAVPFTTPLLAYSRVRKNYREQLELCVTRFSDAGGYYVIPWNAVRDVASLTVHDVLLHEEVSSVKMPDPHVIRMAAFRAAASGLAGVEAAEAAEKAVAADEELKALNQVLLTLRMIEDMVHEEVPSLLRGIMTTSGQARVRGVLFATAAKFDLPPEILDQRLAQLGIGTYSVGVPWSPVEGRLRRVLSELGELCRALVAWSTAHVSDAALTASFCAEVGSVTFKLGSELIQEFDATIAGLRSIVVAEVGGLEKPEGIARRLAWLLDGWDPIIGWWAAGQGKSADEQAVILRDILPILPLVPREELGGSRRFTIDEAVQKSRRYVRLHEDWLTGDVVDIDKTLELERLKAHPA